MNCPRCGSQDVELKGDPEYKQCNRCEKIIKPDKYVIELSRNEIAAIQRALMLAQQHEKQMADNVQLLDRMTDEEKRNALENLISSAAEFDEVNEKLSRYTMPWLYNKDFL